MAGWSLAAAAGRHKNKGNAGESSDPMSKNHYNTLMSENRHTLASLELLLELHDLRLCRMMLEHQPLV